MFLTILFCTITIVLIVLLVLFEDVRDFVMYFDNALGFLYGVILIVASVGALITVAFTMAIQIPATRNYELLLNEKAIIEYRLELMEESDDTYAEIELYRDIAQYNQIVLRNKLWVDNFWVGSFHNEYIAELDLIELD